MQTRPILYACTVFCAVYRIRRGGEPLHPDDIRLLRVTGELRYGIRLLRGQYKIMKAQLLAADGATYVIPVLDQARLLKIEKDGILITGTEIIPTSRGIKNIKSNDYPQTWWCVPIHLDKHKPSDVTAAHARAFTRREQEAAEERRRTQKIGSTMDGTYARRRR
ncbi:MULTISPECIES: hypothetical protein [unclassified Variovorax]|uniref:hypothetical protein n=1 Tax=unclassified Variovorax TaxID=663243 RepID=UPI0025749827|nr:MULTISPECIES: hypothetical protein [unclassified Variovorax]MDM0086738.1 hypothetical protein [Variovorax sp. J22G40]MDM0145006.1 hypothetical protein [Variovorax sp. J2P1-31]